MWKPLLPVSKVIKTSPNLKLSVFQVLMRVFSALIFFFNSVNVVFEQRKNWNWTKRFDKFTPKFILVANATSELFVRVLQLFQQTSILGACLHSAGSYAQGCKVRSNLATTSRRQSCEPRFSDWEKWALTTSLKNVMRVY